MRFSILGVHPVANTAEPCHLIEMLIEGCSGALDFSAFTQELPDEPRGSWQVAYDEHELDAEGTDGKSCFDSSGFVPDGRTRVAFFFHYLDPARPLLTPAGPLVIPPVTPLPSRLRFLRYDPPY